MSEWVRLSPASTVEDGLAATLGGALDALSTVGIFDPVVWVAAGEFCSEMLSGFVSRCADSRSRVRIGDSLKMEPSRLLRGVADERGIRAFAIATSGRHAWRQALISADATLAAQGRGGAVVCEPSTGSARAVALRVAFPDAERVSMARLVCPVEESLGMVEAGP